MTCERPSCDSTPSQPPSPQIGAMIAKAVKAALADQPTDAGLTVLINDPQRHTNSRAVLLEICRHVDPVTIRILVATGTHCIAASRRCKFQAALVGELPISHLAWHDCRDAALVAIGSQWRGHPWLLGPPPVVAIGSVEPHYFAGFTGAHKTCTIGCASHADIEANHAAALDDSSQPARLSGNGVYEGILRMLRALQGAQRVSAINLVQSGGQIVSATSGEPIDALTGLVPTAEKMFIRRIDAAVDALVLEVTGPLGRSFYQADKGIKNNEHAVRDGGCIVLVAGCEDGLGQDNFVSLLREAQTYEQAMDAVAGRGYRLGDHKATRLRKLTDPAQRAVRAFLVSDGLSADEARLLGMSKSASVEGALLSAGVDAARDRVLRVGDAGNACVLRR